MREKVCVVRIRCRAVARKVCVVRIRCGGVARKRFCSKNQVQASCEKVYVDRMRSRGVQQQQQHNNNHRPRQLRFRAILVFRGVVVGVAKANQNLHGMDLHGQRDLSPSCLGPRVAFFSRTGAVGLQAIDAFFTFFF